MERLGASRSPTPVGMFRDGGQIGQAGIERRGASPRRIPPRTPRNQTAAGSGKGGDYASSAQWIINPKRAKKGKQTRDDWRRGSCLYLKDDWMHDKEGRGVIDSRRDLMYCWSFNPKFRVFMHFRAIGEISRDDGGLTCKSPQRNGGLPILSRRQTPIRPVLFRKSLGEIS